MENKTNPSGKEPDENTYMKYMSAGFQIISPVILGVIVGIWLDKRYGTGSRYLVICSSVMIVVALYLFIRQFLKR